MKRVYISITYGILRSVTCIFSNQHYIIITYGILLNVYASMYITLQSDRLRLVVAGFLK